MAANRLVPEKTAAVSVRSRLRETPQSLRSQRGFALLIVLWTLGLLSLLIAGLAATGRSATSVAGNVRDSAIVEAAADGAVRQAIFQLRLGAWPAAGQGHRVVVGQATVDVTMESQQGRINPNLGSPATLAALFGRVGVDPARAFSLAREITDWRSTSPVSVAGGLKVERYRRANLPYGPPGGPFISVDELGLVPGMSADMLARLRPYVSVYQRGDAGGTADAPLSGEAADDTATPSPTQDAIVRIRATAVLADGARFERDATVRLATQVNAGEPPWQVLDWD